MEIATVASSIIAGAALIVSFATLWLTAVRKGTVKMTRPTTVYFGPDGSPEDAKMKVAIGFLLYSTARQGRVVESMYLKLRTRETSQNFPIWVHGINANLSRGTGLYVGPEGTGGLHHFLLTRSNAEFRFPAGEYRLEIVARLVGAGLDQSLYTLSLNLSEDQADALSTGAAGVHFDWGGDHRDYVGWIDERASIREPSPERIIEIMQLLKQPPGPKDE